jgi:hypothetical protein
VTLERELEAFGKQLPELLKDEGKRGKYALVHGDDIDSVWPTIEDALQAGYDRFGLDVFLVKEITEREKPQYFSRNVKRCPSSPATLPMTAP